MSGIDQYTKALLHFDGDALDAISKTDWLSHINHNISLTGSGYRFSDTIKKFGTSLYLDGTGYLTADITDDFSFGDDDFTIDWWEYRLDTVGGRCVFACQKTYDDATYDAFVMGYTEGNVNCYLSNNGADWNILSLFPLGNPKANQWVHRAIVRNGNNFYGFENGVLISTATSSYKIFFDSSWKIFIGMRYVNAFYGYLDEFRVSKGIARWTKSFTPPTEPYSPDEHTVFLCHFENNLDNAGNYVGNYSDSVKKFGKSLISNYAYPYKQSSDFNFGNDDFTIDWWEYRKSFNDGEPSFCIQDSGDNAGNTNLMLGVYNTSGHIRTWMASASENFSIANAQSIGDGLTNQWVHRALVRSGNNFYAYQNGDLYSSWSSSNSLYYLDVMRMNIGKWHGKLFNGYIDEFRVSKGIARWTTSFTPPTEPYSPDSTTIICDVFRAILATQTEMPDTERAVTNNNAIKSDTYRSLDNINTSILDTTRAVQATDTITTDTVRILTTSGSTTIDIDTLRRVIVRNAVNVDTLCMVQATDTITTDTVRVLQVANTVLADTDRIVTGNVQTITADMVRSIIASQSTSSDTVRYVMAIQEIDADTYRRLVWANTIDADTCRAVQATQTVNSDILRRIPWLIKNEIEGEIAITIGISEKTLSDTFTLSTVKNIGIRDAVTGSLYNLPYSFMVDSLHWQGLQRDCHGTYDKDKVMYTPFSYASTDSMTAMAHLQKLADGLGMSLSADFEDFTPTNSFAGYGAVYKNILSGLFGWTGQLPQREINVFVRQNTLYAVQRGYESNVADITDTLHTRPVYQQEIVRSVWSGKGSDRAENNLTIAPEPFTGTKQLGDQTLSYMFGRLMTEKHGDTVTTYDYSGYGQLVGDYLSQKVTTTTDSTITTVYTWTPTANDLYLAMETETTVEKGKTTSVKVTRHHPTGDGYYLTTVEVDGVVTGSDLHQGKPGGRASVYIEDQTSRSLGSGYSEDGGAKLYGASLIDTDFPVKGQAMLDKLTKAIEWLDQKIQETVSTTVYQYPHVIDFTDRIKLDGNEYYLVSNTILKSTKEMKQEIVMVRWLS